MSYACDARLNSMRDFARGKYCTLSPIGSESLQATSDHQNKLPAGYSKSLTNKLPLSFYHTLGCKYDANLCRSFTPYHRNQHDQKDHRHEHHDHKDHRQSLPTLPRPRPHLRVNETALGVSLGGKRQFHGVNVRR